MGYYHYSGHHYNYGYYRRGYCSGFYHRRRSQRFVHGKGCPIFEMTQGEVLNVDLDCSDEVAAPDEVMGASMEFAWISSPNGSQAGDVIGVANRPSDTPYNHSLLEAVVNVQDANLEPGSIWQAKVAITVSDGRVLHRSFKVKVKAAQYVPVVATTTTTTETTSTQGVLITGAAQTIPAQLTSGLYTLTPPFGAAWAVIQFHTFAVWTVDGSNPSDLTSIGFQNNPGGTAELTSVGQIANFRFTGGNDGQDAVQIYVTYFTGNPG